MPPRSIQIGATTDANLIEEGRTVQLRNIEPGSTKFIHHISAAEARRVADDLNRVAAAQEAKQRDMRATKHYHRDEDPERDTKRTVAGEDHILFLHDHIEYESHEDASEPHEHNSHGRLSWAGFVVLRSIMLPPELDRRLADYARAHGLSIHEVVANLCDQHG